MNRSALVRLVVSLALITPALAQNPLEISDKRLTLSVRFDDATEASQRVQTSDGLPAVVLLGPSRPKQDRQYIQTPAGVISQPVTTVQESTAAIELIPRLNGDRVEVEIGRQPVKRSGPLGEWFELGQLGVSAGGETRRLWVKVDAVP